MSTIPAQKNSHPDVDQWLAYHGDQLGQEEEEHLRDHLVGCPDCVSLLLDIEAFHRPEASSTVSDDEMTLVWRSLGGRLRRPWIRRTLPLAAGLIVGVLGLTGWMIEHRTAQRLTTELATLRAPQVNVPIHDLHRDTQVRSGATTAPVTVRSSTFNTLILHLGDLPSYETPQNYQVEILDEDENVVWTQDGFEVDPDFLTVRLALPRGFLPVGEYQIRLYERGTDALVESYPSFIVEP